MRHVPRLTRHLLALAVAALVVLHLWVLWKRLLDGGLLEAEVAIRWLGAVGLGVCALWLQRRGVSLVRGRPAAVFWLAVVVLHAGAPAPLTGAGALAHQLPPELLVVFSIPFGLRWLARRFGTPVRVSALPPRRLVTVPVLAGHYPPALRRPPPR